MAFGDTECTVEMVTRTLLASGYTITGVERSPRHIEIACERQDNLGARCMFLIAATSEEFLSNQEIETLEYTAKRDGRSIVFVGQDPTDKQLSWEDFFDSLGGAVPSWRALAEFYNEWLLETSANRLPTGREGEAWRLFEDLIADGLGFIFGRRVVRLGARKRGQTVSDLVAQVPTSELLVVDAKAASSGFDVSKGALRPLIEYTRRQIERQRGRHRVIGAVIVSSSFEQDNKALDDLAKWFLGETGVALSFVEATLLGKIVDHVRRMPGLRTALRWRQLFTGGQLTERAVGEEIRAADDERYPGRGN